MVFLVIGLVCGVVVGLVSRSVVGGAFAFVAGLVLAYGALPVLDPQFLGTHFVYLAALGLGAAMVALHTGSRGGGISRGAQHLIGVVVALVLVVLVAYGVTTWSVFQWRDYQALIGDVEESTYSTDTSPVDVTEMRVVDQDVARRLGQKLLGENTALGSQVGLGTLNIQQVGGKLYWVGPLEHSGFFKWLGNRSGTPGYVLISATNERDVRLVQDVGDEPLAIRYNKGAWFGDDPARHLYRNGVNREGLTDFTFEIDDDLKPHLVVTTYENRVGFMGGEATGVAVLDVQTGDIERYAVEDAPGWIDRIQPERFVVDQLRDWGQLVHGVFNFSDRDKTRPSPGTSLFYGDDGQSYFYTGLTSVGSDDATVGFVTVNTRTKDARFYRQTGATEQAAMASAEGAVQELEYDASFPILYNIQAQPTYFMTLKDRGGLVKRMAFVSVENYQIVGVGEDKQSALRDYVRTLASRGNEIAPADMVDLAEASGRVLRVRQEPRGERTDYYLLVAGHEHRAFRGSSDLTAELVLTEIGDSVHVRFQDGGNEIVDLMAFDNLGLSFQSTAANEAVRAYGDEVRARDQLERDAQNADAAWERMSPEEKARVLQRAGSNDGGS